MYGVMKSVFDPTKAQALRNVAAYLSKNMDVVMVYDTKSMGWLSTDGHAIYIPMIPDHLVEAYKKILFGGVWHETTHIKRSDFEFLKKHLRELSAVEESMFRYLEDIRCEYHERMENPVAGSEFSMLREYIKETEIQKLKDPEYCKRIITNPDTFLHYVSIVMYVAADGSDISYFPPQILAMYKKIEKDVKEFMQTSRAFKEGTRDSYEWGKKIAKKLLDKIQKATPPPPPPEQQPPQETKEGLKDEEYSDEHFGKSSQSEPESGEEGRDNSDSDSRDVKGGGKSKKEKNKKNKQEQDTASGDSDSDAGRKDDSKSNSEKGRPDNDTETSDGNEDTDISVEINVMEKEDVDKARETVHRDTVSSSSNGTMVINIVESDKDHESATEKQQSLEDLLKQAKKEGVKDLIVNLIIDADKEIKDQMRGIKKAEHIPHPAVLKKDEEIKVQIDKKADSLEAQRKKYEELERSMAREIKTMRMKTEALLLGKRRTHFIPDKEEGEIDTAAIYKLANGDKLVFQQLDYTRRMNTAITILVDMSGSMTGPKIIEAQKAVIACGKLCHLLRTPFEILGFSTSLDVYPGDMTVYNRFAPLIHFIFKEFHENFDRVKYRLLKIRALYDNIDHESVLWAANRLIVRPESRKILIVFSDGHPLAANSERRLLAKCLKKAVKDITARGIEVYGIGVHSTAVEKFYPNYSVITHDGSETLAVAVYKVLSKALIRGIK